MRMVLLAVLAGSIVACANDMTAPAVQPTPESAVSATGNRVGGPWAFGRRGYGMAGPLFAVRRLPDNLKLTDAQRGQIKSLVASFRAAHQEDLTALRTAMKTARAARAANETRDQRRALFARTAPQRQRLAAANQQLAAQIQQVLTAEQRAWLTSHRPSFQRGQRMHARQNA